jgi:hypothetical protein
VVCPQRRCVYNKGELVMIRFVEVINRTDKNPRMERTAKLAYELGEVWINEKYVVNVREHAGYNRMLKEGKLNLDLDLGHRFTAVTLVEGNSSSVHIVVGDAATVAKKLAPRDSRLLKG